MASSSLHRASLRSARGHRSPGSAWQDDWRPWPERLGRARCRWTRGFPCTGGRCLPHGGGGARRRSRPRRSRRGRGRPRRSNRTPIPAKNRLDGVEHPARHVVVQGVVGGSDDDAVFTNRVSRSLKDRLAHADAQCLGLVGSGDDASIVVGQHDDRPVLRCDGSKTRSQEA